MLGRDEVTAQLRESVVNFDASALRHVELVERRAPLVASPALVHIDPLPQHCRVAQMEPEFVEGRLLPSSLLALVRESNELKDRHSAAAIARAAFLAQPEMPPLEAALPLQDLSQLLSAKSQLHALLKRCATLQLAPPPPDRNSWWCTLACMQRCAIALPADVRKLLYHFYVRALYATCAPAVRGVLQRRTLQCVVEGCVDGIDYPAHTSSDAAFAVETWSALLYRAWFSKHLALVHGSSWEAFGSNYGDCDCPCDATHVHRQEEWFYMGDYEVYATEYCTRCARVTQPR